MPTLTKEDVLVCPRLPSLPKVAIDVLELTRDKDVKLSEIAQTVQNDQALSSKIIKTVNSSYYGLSKPCPSIIRALAYLGLSTVKSLVLGFSLVDIAGTDDESFDLVDYWRRGIYSAAAARRIASLHGKCDTEEAFLGALMQDVGMIAINAAVPKEYGALLQETNGRHGDLVAREREVFGFDHAEIGADVGERCWQLPEGLVEAIRHHHDGKPVQHCEVAQSVALGGRAAATLCVEDPASLARLNDRGAQWFGFEPDELSQLLIQIARDASRLSSLFKISTGETPDVLSILAEAQEAGIQHQLEIQKETEQLRQTNDELARKATTDALTNVANRSRFDQELLSRFDQAQSFKGCLGIALCDLDRFKRVNDTYGHQVGDAVLVEIAARLAGSLRGADMVCRYGGEEFVVVLPGATRRDAAMVAERLRAVIEHKAVDLSAVKDSPPELEVTASFGVAVYEPETRAAFTSPDVIVGAADKALYAAKQAGRNCVRVFRLRQAA
jgi:diguanylate cyclase (GGDEF)-like protein